MSDSCDTTSPTQLRTTIAELLELQKRESEWQEEKSLFSKLSLLILVPFPLKTLGISPSTILSIGFSGINQRINQDEEAGVLLARLVSRHDANEQIELLVDGKLEKYSTISLYFGICYDLLQACVYGQKCRDWDAILPSQKISLNTALPIIRSLSISFSTCPRDQVRPFAIMIPRILIEAAGGAERTSLGDEETDIQAEDSDFPPLTEEDRQTARKSPLFTSPSCRVALSSLVTSCGLVFSHKRPCAWAYSRGSRSLLTHVDKDGVQGIKKAGIEGEDFILGGYAQDPHRLKDEEDSSQPGSPHSISVHEKEAASEQTISEEDDEEVGFDVPVLFDDCFDVLLCNLTHSHTQVRSEAAKGLGTLTARIPRSFARDVLESILSLFSPAEPPESWHGACICLAELIRRGLVEKSQLHKAVDVIHLALQTEFRSGRRSAAASVRDGACFCVWSLSRAYNPEDIMPFAPSLSSALLCVCVFDREVNVRRAASAAFQECVGRLGVFEHGIKILAIADFYSVGNVHNSFLRVSPTIAALSPTLRRSFISHLISPACMHHWDPLIRHLSARCVGKLCALEEKEYVRESILPGVVPLLRDASRSEEAKHGALLCVGEIVACVMEEKEEAGLSGGIYEDCDVTVEKEEEKGGKDCLDISCKASIIKYVINCLYLPHFMSSEIMRIALLSTLSLLAPSLPQNCFDAAIKLLVQGLRGEKEGEEGRKAMKILCLRAIDVLSGTDKLEEWIILLVSLILPVIGSSPAVAQSCSNIPKEIWGTCLSKDQLPDVILSQLPPSSSFEESSLDSEHENITPLSLLFPLLCNASTSPASDILMRKHGALSCCRICCMCVFGEAGAVICETRTKNLTRPLGVPQNLTSEELWDGGRRRTISEIIGNRRMFEEKKQEKEKKILAQATFLPSVQSILSQTIAVIKRELRDYSTNQCGDVGSWARRACLIGGCELCIGAIYYREGVDMLAVQESSNRTNVTKLLASLSELQEELAILSAKMTVEKIDGLKDVAGSIFSFLLSPDMCKYSGLLKSARNRIGFSVRNIPKIDQHKVSKKLESIWGEGIDAIGKEGEE
ncbi:Tubulin-folding cofactor D like protein, partial [Aduncisulcus paluster]